MSKESNYVLPRSYLDQPKEIFKLYKDALEHVDDNVMTRAIELHRKAENKSMTNQRSKRWALVLSIFTASREQGTGLLPSEVMDALYVFSEDGNSEPIYPEDLDHFLNSYKKFKRELDVQTGPPSPTDFIESARDELMLDEKTVSRAREITNDMKNRGLTQGKNPRTVSAAATYLATKETGKRRTQSQVCKKFNISRTSMIKLMKEYKVEVV